MKFSTRVQLVIVLSALMVMLASSAWAADYRQTVEVTLDSTGTRLGVTVIYWNGNQRYAIFDILTNQQIQLLSSLPISLDILRNGSIVNTPLSILPVTINRDSVSAIFNFPRGFEEGEYLFIDAGFNGDGIIDEEWEKRFNALGTTTLGEFVERFDELFGENDINQIVTIRKESSSDTSNGCNAGIGMLTLALLPLLLKKRRQ